MRCFDENIVSLLNQECSGEAIHFIGLGYNDFQLSFGRINRIQTMEKAVFSIDGKVYQWENGPSDVPVWMLIGQTPKVFALNNPYSFRLILTSGDYVDFYTDESPYEAAIIDFGVRGDSLVMEVF